MATRLSWLAQRFLAISLALAAHQAGATAACGNVLSDTTWSAAQSPIEVTCQVVLQPGATLTIEPGVVVRFAAGAGLTVRGALEASGTSAAPIRFGSVTPGTRGSWSGIYVATSQGGKANLRFAQVSDASSGLSVECCGAGGPVTIEDSSFANNYTALAGYAGWVTNVRRTRFENNATAVRDADKNISDSVFLNNDYGLNQVERTTVANSHFEGHLVALSGRFTATNNEIVNNVVGVRGGTLTLNTISGNDVGVEIDGYGISATNNNIFGNATYNVRNTTANAQSMPENWWGTTDVAAIAASIRDGLDVPQLGIVTFTPIRTSPAAPPATLVAIAIRPMIANILVGQTQLFVASGTFSDGTTRELSDVLWASNNPSVASIDATGTARGLGGGGASISATKDGITTFASLGVEWPTLQSITVTPVTALVEAGQTQQFTATGAFNDGSIQTLTNVSWTSNNTAVATVDLSGRARGVTGGQATITASRDGVGGSATLTVNPPTLQSIALSPPAARIRVGETAQLSVLGTYSDGVVRAVASGVSWSSSDSSLATVSASGLVKAVGVGTVTVIASVEGKSASATITLSPPLLIAISVAPANVEISVGQAQAFVATGSFSDGSTAVLAEVSWSSSNPAVAGVDSQGRVSGIAPGTVTIAASRDGKTGTATLAVKAIELQSIAISPISPSVRVAETVQLRVAGRYSDGSLRPVSTGLTWSSGNQAIATVDASGLVRGNAAGTSAITAVVEGKVATVTVTVNPPLLRSIAVTPSNASIFVGQSQAFIATGTFSDGSTGVVAAVQWSVSDSAIANVDSGGLVRSLAGGVVTVVATHGGLSSSAALTVVVPVLQSLTLAPESAALIVGQQQRFAATGRYSDGSLRDVSATTQWRSSEAAVASVDASGLVTGVGAGSASLVASKDGISATVAIVVSRKFELVSIEVSPSPSVSLAVGGSVQLTATGRYSDGSSADITATVRWASSDKKVVDVSQAGIATGVAGGAAEVTASQGPVSKAVAVLVGNNAAPVANDDSTSTVAGSSVTVRVLRNDSDADGDILRVSRIVEGPVNGAAMVKNDDSIHYTPAPGFTGTDALVYEVSDGRSGYAIARVTIVVTAR